MESGTNEIEELLSMLDNEAMAAEMDDKTDELYFDDEPLENVLYEKKQDNPSRANLFLQDLRNLKKLEKACMEKNIPEVISAITELGKNGNVLPLHKYMKIAALLSNIFPCYPKPVMTHDLTAFRPLLEKIWETAVEKKDADLQIKGGTLLYRWYEHHCQYEKARDVLKGLISIYHKQGNSEYKGSMLNNLAFEYLLEERWSEAIPIFEEAITISKIANISFDYENSLANYWICRFALNDYGNINETSAEIEKLVIFFRGKGLWHERKPLIILARIEEMGGNFDKAIELVESAIESAKNSNTIYPEIDRKYLEELNKKRARRCN